MKKIRFKLKNFFSNKKSDNFKSLFLRNLILNVLYELTYCVMDNLLKHYPLF